MNTALKTFVVLLIAAVTSGAPNNYVGSKVCAGCHQQIYLTYSKTDMGRSMTSDLAAIPTGSITVRDDTINRYFQVHTQRDGMYQSEYELAADGSVVFRREQKITYTVGAGRNGISYLVERDGFLFQAPLSYYSLAAKWDMSPGFQSLDLGFNRPVLAGCVECHSGRANPKSSGVGEYERPAFTELAIGCENCHGPGSRHVAEHGQRLPVRRTSDPSIVNPAKLSPWLADNICMACHQGRTLRVLQPGKNFLDFRPGMPLNDVMAIFVAPLKDQSSSASISPLLEHYTLMSLSKCFTGTQGRLSCVTCHDPHIQPGAETVNYFRQKCLSCHRESSCSLPIESRKAQSHSDDCVGCHMPKVPVTGIAHSILTNHRIVRTETEPFPTALFNSSKPIANGLIHLDAEIGRPDHVPDLSLFRAYTELATTNSVYIPQYLDLLRVVAEKNPEEPDVLSALAWRRMGTGPEQNNAEALNYLRRAIDRGSVRLEDYETLADVLSKSGQTSEAIRVLENGIRIAPFDERMYKELAFIYMSTHRYPEALTLMKQIVNLFPEDDFMRSLLQKTEPSASPR